MIREIIRMRNEWQQTFGNRPEFVMMNQITWEKVFKELRQYSELPVHYSEVTLMGMLLKINKDMDDGVIMLGD